MSAEEDVPTLAATPALQHAIIGPCMAGYQCQVLLFGILLQQWFSYSGELKSHSKLSKYVAVVVVAFNVVYTALCFEDGYTLAAGADRTLNTLATGTIESQFLPLFNGLVAASAEAFLTLRAGAFFLNKKAKIAFYAFESCLILLVLFGSIASCAVGVVSFYRPDAPYIMPYNTVVAIWLWSSAAADCSISIALAYNLYRRIAHFNEKTDSVLRKLILIGLRTASFTAILSLVAATISSIYSGHDASAVSIAIALWVPTGALYGISLFTTLSSTRSVVEKRLGGSSASGPPTKPVLRRSRSTSGAQRLSHLPIPLEINVHREVVRDVDVGLDEEKSDVGFEGSFERSFERRDRLKIPAIV
ncbi:hypothetical protein JCM3765_005609 [Sporobolomyces pararoseus]